ncbi:MAG TPA: hypothetical protein VNW92_28295 [Polyangiaceae bacterium]|jgi:hypothetical protein|nr:hypothetical protein [Polyangiaceae bacterium]
MKITNIDLEKLPTKKQDVLALDLDFPRLEEDSPHACPCSLAEIRKYLNAEAGGNQRDLIFGRTAQIGGVRFWLWGYVDSGKAYFVDVSENGGDMAICMGSGEGLTPEQYMALRYARRWRGRTK